MLNKISMVLFFGIFVLLSGLNQAEKHVAIPAAAFHPETQDEDYRIFSDESTGHYLIKYTSPGGFVAPVYFPQENGQILAMKVLVQDEVKNGCMDIFLFRTCLSTGESEAVFGIVTDNQPGQVITITDVPIFHRNQFDNREYAWFVRIGFYDSVQGLRFYNVQLVYD